MRDRRWCCRQVHRGSGSRVPVVVGLALLGIGLIAGETWAEPIVATEIVYRLFQPGGGATPVLVGLELYGRVPGEVAGDAPKRRRYEAKLSRVFERAYRPFFRGGWTKRRPPIDGPFILRPERVRVDLDRRRRGDVIVYHNQVCDPDDLFNKKKYREGRESFDEYWQGLVQEVDRCLEDRFPAR